MAIVDRAAWLRAVQDGVAPQYKFKGIPGCYYTFGDALANSREFMDWYVQQRVIHIMANFDERYRQAYFNHLYETFDEVHYKSHEDGECVCDHMDIEIHDLAQDDRYREEWVRKQVAKNADKLIAKVKAQAAQPDCPWRKNHPPEGIYARGQRCVIPFAFIAGFCPRCHEPATSEGLYEDSSRQWSLSCSACRGAGTIRSLEAQYGHPFNVIPYTDTLVDTLRAA
jgi:hypothetical protein